MSPIQNISFERNNLSSQVADKIEGLIVSKSLLPGERLPSERELGERMDVSRTVIREATRILTVRGLVDVKPGSGTYIQKVDSSIASASIGRYLKSQNHAKAFQDLCEVRFALEIEIAGIAAENATDEDIQSMEEAIEKMAKCTDDPEQFTRNDQHFHSALVVATKNPLFSMLIAPILDLLLDFRMTEYQFDPKESVKGGLIHHRLILERIRYRDKEGARMAMRNHLIQAQDIFIAHREKSKI